MVTFQTLHGHTRLIVQDLLATVQQQDYNFSTAEEEAFAATRAMKTLAFGAGSIIGFSSGYFVAKRFRAKPWQGIAVGTAFGLWSASKAEVVATVCSLVHLASLPTPVGGELAAIIESLDIDPKARNVLLMYRKIPQDAGEQMPRISPTDPFESEQTRQQASTPQMPSEVTADAKQRWVYQDGRARREEAAVSPANDAAAAGMPTPEVWDVFDDLTDDGGSIEGSSQQQRPLTPQQRKERRREKHQRLVAHSKHPEKDALYGYFDDRWEPKRP